MNTLMQVAGAIGAALFISVMENGQQRYLANLGISEPTAEQTVEALIYGSQQSFSTGFFFACAAVVLSFFIKRSKQTQPNKNVHPFAKRVHIFLFYFADHSTTAFMLCFGE